MRVALLIVCLLSISQAVWDGGVLQPPRKGLVALHAPDLTQAEESVREQVRELQNSLAAVAKNPASSPAVLSDAYGRLAEIYHAYSLLAPLSTHFFSVAPSTGSSKKSGHSKKPSIWLVTFHSLRFGEFRK